MKIIALIQDIPPIQAYTLPKFHKQWEKATYSTLLYPFEVIALGVKNMISFKIFKNILIAINK